MSGRTRLIGLDFVRGIAAALVMIQHTFESAGLAETIWHPFEGYANLGQAGVVAFFLVSGFVIPMSLEKTGNQRSFWIGRAFRLYPMYIFSFLLGIIFLDGSYDLATVVSHLFFVQEYIPGVRDQVPNSWTLSIEMLWYVCASCLLAMGMLGNSRLLMRISLSALIIIGIAAWITPAIPAGRFAMLVSCIVGMLVFRHISGHSDERMRICFLSIAVFVLIAIAFRIENGMPRDRFLPQTILAAWAVGYGVFFFGVLFGEKLPGRMVFAWLGRISYSVYLTHSFLIMLGVMAGFSSWTLVFFVIMATCTVSTLTYHLVELPTIRVGRMLMRSSALPQR